MDKLISERNWIGIPFLRSWLYQKANDYSIIASNSLSISEKTEIIGKLALIEELLKLLNEDRRSKK